MQIGDIVNVEITLGYDFKTDTFKKLNEVKLLDKYNILGIEVPVFLSNETINANFGICIKDSMPIIEGYDYKNIILLYKDLFKEDKMFIDYIIFHEIGHIVMSRVLGEYELLFMEDDLIETLCDIYSIDILNINNDSIDNIINKMIECCENNCIINTRMNRLKKYKNNRIGIQSYIANIFNEIIEDMQYISSKERFDRYDIQPKKDLFTKIKEA